MARAPAAGSRIQSGFPTNAPGFNCLAVNSNSSRVSVPEARAVHSPIASRRIQRWRKLSVGGWVLACSRAKRRLARVSGLRGSSRSDRW